MRGGKNGRREYLKLITAKIMLRGGELTYITMETLNIPHDLLNSYFVNQ